MTEHRWRRSRATLWRRTIGGVVLLPEHASDPIHLAGAAALVWDLLEEPTTISEATDLLARACAVDPAQVRDDVDDVLRQLGDLAAVEAEGVAPC